LFRFKKINSESKTMKKTKKEKEREKAYLGQPSGRSVAGGTEFAPATGRS
jgi:hypothetical protein